MRTGAGQPGIARRRRGGRRPASEGNHAARISILELKFPKGMRARCAWCDSVTLAAEGRWLEVLFSSPGSGVTTGRVFQCRGCLSTTSLTGGTGLVTVPKPQEDRSADVSQEREDAHTSQPAAEEDESFDQPPGPEFGIAG